MRSSNEALMFGTAPKSLPFWLFTRNLREARALVETSAKSVFIVARPESEALPTWRSEMKRIPKSIYQTADEIEARIKGREADALWLEPGSEMHRAILKEIAQLRVYAEAKRWMAKPALRPVR